MLLRSLGLLVLFTVILSHSTPSWAEHKARLSIAPASAPVPLMAYRLLPDPRDTVPGNAAAPYYRTEAMFVENGAPKIVQFSPASSAGVI